MTGGLVSLVLFSFVPGDMFDSSPHPGPSLAARPERQSDLGRYLLLNGLLPPAGLCSRSR